MSALWSAIKNAIRPRKYHLPDDKVIDPLITVENVDREALDLDDDAEEIDAIWADATTVEDYKAAIEELGGT